MVEIDKDYFNIDDAKAINANEVSDILEKDEEILLETTPDKKDYILEAVFKSLPVTLLWLGVDIFFIVMLCFNPEFTKQGLVIFFIIVFFALHLLPVWMYVARIIKRVAEFKNIKYVFTDKRVIARSGLIGIDYKFVYYNEINSVDVKVGVLDRILKVGDINITSNNKVVILEDIKNPYQIANKVQGITRDIKTDMLFPNDLRPSTNHGYKTKLK